MPLHHQELTELIIGSAIEVHRHLGPGLLESAYRRCLVHELRLRKVPVASVVDGGRRDRCRLGAAMHHVVLSESRSAGLRSR